MYLTVGIANFRAANLSLHLVFDRVGLVSVYPCVLVSVFFVDLAQSSINSQATQVKGASDTCSMAALANQG